MHRGRRATATVLAALALIGALAGLRPAVAQTQQQPQAPQPPQAQGPSAAAGVPGFWDPRRRPERPDMGRITLIRFMTEVDYPPFE
jgi:polar amino acid transport system substrate-binding protein